MDTLFQNIEFLGMLSLGCFVGGIMNYGLSKIDNSDSFLKISTSILGSAMSGVVFVFLEFLMRIHQHSSIKSVFMYPIGLILSLLWLQIIVTIKERIKSESWQLQIIGWLHFTFVSGITILILYGIILGKKIDL